MSLGNGGACAPPGNYVTNRCFRGLAARGESPASHRERVECSGDTHHGLLDAAARSDLVMRRGCQPRRIDSDGATRRRLRDFRRRSRPNVGRCECWGKTAPTLVDGQQQEPGRLRPTHLTSIDASYGPAFASYLSITQVVISILRIRTAVRPGWSRDPDRPSVGRHMAVDWPTVRPTG